VHTWSGSKPHGSPPGREEFVAPAVDNGHKRRFHHVINSDEVFGTHRHGQPVHSFRTLLADLATLTRNTDSCGKGPKMALLARPTEIQQRALDLLGVKLHL
jgi:hypothetical protein